MSIKHDINLLLFCHAELVSASCRNREIPKQVRDDDIQYIS